MTTPHKHAALIKAWADGAIIERRIPSPTQGNWIVVKNPEWGEGTHYRIKPEPKPDVVVNALMYFKHAWKSPGIHLSWNGTAPEGYKHNLTLNLDCITFTFDGETDKLKSVEIVK